MSLLHFGDCGMGELRQSLVKGLLDPGRDGAPAGNPQLPHCHPAKPSHMPPCQLCHDVAGHVVRPTTLSRESRCPPPMPPRCLPPHPHAHPSRLTHALHHTMVLKMTMAFTHPSMLVTSPSSRSVIITHLIKVSLSHMWAQNRCPHVFLIFELPKS